MPVLYNLKGFNFVDKVGRRTDKKLAVHRGSTVFSVLRNKKDHLNDLEKQGVYKIPVKEVLTQKKQLHT